MNFKSKFRRVCWLLLLLVVILGGYLLQPAWHLGKTAWNDIDELEPLAEGHVDDASRLNKTEVAEVWRVPVDREDPEGQIAELLARARAEGLHVAVAGARHSMGGHTIYPGGISLDMLPFNGMQLDEKRDILTVQSGALWEDVLAYLGERGRSVAVMQSNDSFSVGGSISVNCHGWQYGRSPIASTVESFRLMKADGSIIRCGRAENSELFSLALGGYGLFGVILDVELRVVPNQRYRHEQYIVPVWDLMQTVETKIDPVPGVQMAFGRMNVTAADFLEEVVVNVFIHEPDGEVPELKEPGLEALRRSVFRGSVDSEYGKELRWKAETQLQPLLADKVVSRNQLLHEGVEVFENRTAATTDILHEYFVPRYSAHDFIGELRKIVPQHEGNLLNVTIRFVEDDTETFLRYADQSMVAFVMLFNQERTQAGEAKMRTMTRELIDAAIEHGGRYYLPYRLHATREQFAEAYPQGREFFELKRKHDPGELFQNGFWLKYGAEQGEDLQ